MLQPWGESKGTVALKNGIRPWTRDAMPSAQVLPNVLFPEGVGVELAAPVERSPHRLVLEEPHGVDVLRGVCISSARMHDPSRGEREREDTHVVLGRGKAVVDAGREDE